MKTRFLLLSGIFGIAILVASFNFKTNRVLASVPGTNTLVTAIDGSPSIAANRGGGSGTISGNGKFVVFDSASTNLLSTYTPPNYAYVFKRNLSNNTTDMITVSTSGVVGDHGGGGGVISETGRYVVFDSNSTNLIDGTTITSADAQLYLRDTVTNTTTLLSKNSSGTLANGYTLPYDVSVDGRFVLFASSATNLGTTITNTGAILYMLDSSTGTFTVINKDYTGALRNNTSDLHAHMSCDGSLVVFDSNVNLTSGYSPHIDTYLVDTREGNNITDISISANGAAIAPHISCNGNYIGFSSYANNLDQSHLGGTEYYHAYIYDCINGTFTIADQDSSGNLATTNSFQYNSGPPIGDPTNIAISDNGITVFGTPASNLDGSATSGIYNTFVHNLNDGTTYLLSQNNSGIEGGGYSVSISNDGELASYMSASTSLVSSTDTNNAYDMFTSDTGY